MYGKLFVSIYDGTLAEDWRALVTFQQMIILCDQDGILDMTPLAIQKRTGIPIEHIKAGIEILESEDPYSRTPKEHGKRIIRISEDRPWGWQIVNHKHYRDLRTAEERREYMREYMREKRAKDKLTKTNKSLPKLLVSKLANTDTDTDTEAVKREKRILPRNSKNGKALPKDWVLPKDWRTWTETKCPLVDPDSTAEEMKDWALGNSNRPIAKKADWFATWRNWCRRDQAKYEEQEKWAKRKK